MQLVSQSVVIPKFVSRSCNTVTLTGILSVVILQLVSQRCCNTATCISNFYNIFLGNCFQDKTKTCKIINKLEEDILDKSGIFYLQPIVENDHHKDGGGIYNERNRIPQQND